MQTRIANCDQLNQYMTECDKYIAEFLYQSKSELVTLYKMLIKFYYKKPFTSAVSELTTTEIGKLATSVTMNLAETDFLDENLDTTKNLISQTLTSPKTDEMESVVSFHEDNVSKKI